MLTYQSARQPELGPFHKDVFEVTGKVTVHELLGYSVLSVKH